MMTPGDVQVFEKKIQISFKKSVDTLLHVQLKRELLPRTTRKNKKSKKSKKSIDTIFALLLQAMFDTQIPSTIHIITIHEKEIRFTICIF